MKELRDFKKSTHVYLSSKNGNLSWENTTAEEICYAKEVAVVKYLCESTFRVSMEEINAYRNIKLQNVGDIEMAKNNGYFAAGHKKISKGGKFIYSLHNVSNIMKHFRQQV